MRNSFMCWRQWGEGLTCWNLVQGVQGFYQGWGIGQTNQLWIILSAWFDPDQNKVSLLVKFQFKKLCLLVRKTSCLPTENKNEIPAGSGCKYNCMVGLIIGLLQVVVFFNKKAKNFSTLKMDLIQLNARSEQPVRMLIIVM